LPSIRFPRLSIIPARSNQLIDLGNVCSVLNLDDLLKMLLLSARNEIDVDLFRPDMFRSNSLLPGQRRTETHFNGAYALTARGWASFVIHRGSASVILYFDSANASTAPLVDRFVEIATRWEPLHPRTNVALATFDLSRNAFPLAVVTERPQIIVYPPSPLEDAQTLTQRRFSPDPPTMEQAIVGSINSVRLREDRPVNAIKDDKEIPQWLSVIASIINFILEALA